MKKNEYFNEVEEIYNDKKLEINKRLEEFKEIWEKGSNNDIHVELSFCILTPQSKARNAWSAITKLRDNGLLFNGAEKEIVDYLNVVRFKNNKAKFLVRLREQMSNEAGKLITKNFFESIPTVLERRDWIVSNIKGMAFKEAGHFLRNVGFGQEIAILDRHILRNLVRLGVIDEIPKSLTKKLYLEIEERMKEFCNLCEIRMDELDLLLWYKEAGEIFK
ncbi:MAG: N-glycosylase/DNA lyase [Fusobacteriaceae bacterium]|jgi:N-glycosylase/DNA lyase|nr:N-glycosylase/DNA lyase [Fusobacteriaceae bacterium]